MNFFHKWLCILLLPFFLLSGEESDHPFGYDLHVTVLPGKNQKTMICCHGMGGSWRVAEGIKKSTNIEETLISFNFPDHGIRPSFDPNATSYGTIQEILPLIYLLKKAVVDENRSGINLYGFSAGGGAIINTLAILNSSSKDHWLKDIGVNQEDKQKILRAIQNGTILLDAPLKSISEIVAFRGSSPELEVFAKRYQENRMEPIEVLDQLNSLSLHVIVNFQDPDEILSNRDDRLYVERLNKANAKGITKSISSHEKGHAPPHPALWEAYLQQANKIKPGITIS